MIYILFSVKLKKNPILIIKNLDYPHSALKSWHVFLYKGQGINSDSPIEDWHVQHVTTYYATCMMCQAWQSWQWQPCACTIPLTLCSFYVCSICLFSLVLGLIHFWHLLWSVALLYWTDHPPNLEKHTITHTKFRCKILLVCKLARSDSNVAAVSVLIGMPPESPPGACRFWGLGLGGVFSYSSSLTSVLSLERFW